MCTKLWSNDYYLYIINDVYILSTYTHYCAYIINKNILKIYSYIKYIPIFKFNTFTFNIKH